jgi:16S rRNA (adenine1518-N6/adenine1519-N6)-dimethyltransferase
MNEPLPPLREVIARHGLSARKGLGQNFLLDLNLTRRIARAAGPLSGHSIIEVGPGPGGLTRALIAEGASHVIAIEKDARAIPALEEVAAAFPGRLTIIAQDALAVDWRSLAQASPQRCRVKIVANLPYNASTPLLASWLGEEPWPPWYESMTLMFQKEVADRITAQPGGKVYGRLSVLAQWRARAAKLFDIDRRAFTPPPKVTSSLVQIVPGPPCLAGLKTIDIERVTAQAFGQRRKMLRASLRGLGRDVETLLAHACIDPTLRAEQLSVEDFCRLASVLKGGDAR